jgi:hypothetical protein
MNAFPAKSLSDNRTPVVSNTEPSAIETTGALGYSFCAVVLAEAQQPTKVPR